MSSTIRQLSVFLENREGRLDEVKSSQKMTSILWR